MFVKAQHFHTIIVKIHTDLYSYMPRYTDLACKVHPVLDRLIDETRLVYMLNLRAVLESW